MHSAEAVPALLEALDDAVDSRSVAVVTTAVSAIQNLGPAAAPYVVADLEQKESSRRQFLPLLLASALGSGALPFLLGTLSDPDAGVAINAATQIGLLRIPDAFDPLLAVLRDPEKPSVLRGAAAAALGASRDERALPILIDLLAAPDRDILAGAIDGLADLRDPAGAPHLEKLLERSDLDQSTERAIRLGLLAMERYRSP
jgi:HEAT repeat protein